MEDVSHLHIDHWQEDIGKRIKYLEKLHTQAIKQSKTNIRNITNIASHLRNQINYQEQMLLRKDKMAKDCITRDINVSIYHLKELSETLTNFNDKNVLSSKNNLKSIFIDVTHRLSQLKLQENCQKPMVFKPDTYINTLRLGEITNSDLLITLKGTTLSQQDTSDVLKASKENISKISGIPVDNVIFVSQEIMLTDDAALRAAAAAGGHVIHVRHSQWVSAASADSSYDWLPTSNITNIVGAPGENYWISYEPHWSELTFEKSVIPSAIHIYSKNINKGDIQVIKAKHGGDWVSLWKADLFEQERKTGRKKEGRKGGR